MSLAEHARALQAEADRLLGRLDLRTAFPWRAQVIGSALSGLMILRDLDVMFDAPDATAAHVITGLATLSERVELLTADFRDERGDRRPTSRLTDERFYAVLHVNGSWKVDLTFWLHVVERPHVPEALRLRAASEEQRLTILRLKHECPNYPDTIGGTDIYAAVLERGVKTIDELLAS
ncbi:hypothetical protein AB0I81_28210 [Nonomuraea sp. NPDC050404]|uniref:hypothetical protein n=1 Tax=Nonomuraea sp. NPDC050404 TaxID=3155783 RepID=UPI0033DB0105